MKLNKIGRTLVLTLSCVLTPSLSAEDAFTRKEDVIYGRKFGVALTMDVFTPKSPNGVGVIWVVSGGWFSSHDAITPPYPFIADLLKRGYTVFAVVHGSQPKFTIPEILEDMHRSVRFIRYHAKDYKIDSERIGITGASAGGHLSLMQGTAGTAGDPKAKDPVDRVSSRVQAVACFFPPTDFLNYGKPGENAIGRGVLKDFAAPFDFKEHAKSGYAGIYVPVKDEKKIEQIGKLISPVNHVSADDAPTLIIHGDKDFLVPLQQAQIVVEKFKQAKVPAELIVKKNGAHGWMGIEKDFVSLGDWFDQQLKAK